MFIDMTRQMRKELCRHRFNELVLKGGIIKTRIKRSKRKNGSVNCPLPKH